MDTIKLDFVDIREEYLKKTISIYPEFIVRYSKDLMTRGKAFYAIWNENIGLWSKDEGDVQVLIDEMISEYAKTVNNPEYKVSPKYLANFSSNKWTEWQKFCKALPDRYKDLDEKIFFSNQKVTKKDYVTKILPYPLEEISTPSYDELMETLYDESEREKLEWAIGSIISGDSKSIQKFIVLYGGPGTGKSTVLNIIQMMFPGYYALFEAKELTSNGDFALESLKDNALIGIQHDGDLSRIEDNTRLNSIVSHEEMVINEKFKSKYKLRFKTFLFMGTNKPVKITDANSGIVRRLIDVVPTGKRVERSKYEKLMGLIKFELSGIAFKCLKTYERLGYKHYDSYIPSFMINATNDFYNFIVDNLDLFMDSEEGIALKVLWRRYKEYCEDAMIQYPMNMRVFKTELKSYFRNYHDRLNGQYSVYSGFIEDKFVTSYKMDSGESDRVTDGFYEVDWLKMEEQASDLDDILKDCPAQYAKDDGTPLIGWDFVETKLSDLNTSKLHYVRVPENHIVIDFDISDQNGNKNFHLNLKEALKWPRTYAELSKSGNGIHLHYIYLGDVSKLSRLYAENIEIKVFNGKSSLRRMLTKCNNNPIASINSGLPLKMEKKNMIKEETIKSEKSLRNLIERNLRKEIHPGTKPSIDFIYDILEGTYQNGLKYDVSDMFPKIQNFALNSTHQADYCLRMVSKMKFKSDEPSTDVGFSREAPIVFFDVEIFPNVFIVCFKKLGSDTVIRLINPEPKDIEGLTKFRLVGFNNRDYDNHMLYAKMMAYSVAQLYDLSQRIIVEKDRNAKFGEAYNLSYTDVYDYMSAANKASLKKWEIKLHISHREFPHPWDVPLYEEVWESAADYCVNDVRATEAVWNATKEDFRAREILAEWVGMTVNDTTNSITIRLIVGNDPNPQRKFIYTDLSTIFPGYEFNQYGIDPSKYKEGIKIVQGKSIYKGKDPGEGGYAIGYPGISYMDAVLDVKSMHPHSAIKLKVFGEEYTSAFKNIVDARVYIKDGDYEKCKEILPEKLHKYLDDPDKAEELSTALKTPINSAYGLTSAKFPNKLRDPRNVDNIVAKYGALFMINLEEEVTNQGFNVIHIKTDSIKIENATPEIIKFCMDYAKQYGFEFEHESTYSKMALMNDAVYIAKYADPYKCMELYGYVPKNNRKHVNEWTATGTQFQVPYVFKTLFSKEKIEFYDICETKSVTTSMYLDYNEDLPDVLDLEIEYDKLVKKLSRVSPDALEEERIKELPDLIEKGHDRRFVGKVGLFTPVKPGYGGGILLRENNGKFSAVNGTKIPGSKYEAYRWLEAEVAKDLPWEAFDLRYYENLVNEAVEDISKYGDFEAFVNDDYSPESDKVPFEEDFPMNAPEFA